MASTAGSTTEEMTRRAKITSGATMSGGTNQIPLFLDCSWYGAGPLDIDYPPEYEGHTASGTGDWRDNKMRRFCLNRHAAAMTDSKRKRFDAPHLASCANS